MEFWNAAGTLQDQYILDMSSLMKKSLSFEVLHTENKCPSWNREGSLKGTGLTRAQFSALRSAISAPWVALLLLANALKVDGPPYSPRIKSPSSHIRVASASNPACLVFPWSGRSAATQLSPAGAYFFQM